MICPPPSVEVWIRIPQWSRPNEHGQSIIRGVWLRLA